jgi:hypothetical protein
MIIVHETFICKPGNASKLAKMFKESMGDKKDVEIMTDMTGEFNKVVIVSKYESIEDYGKMSEKYMHPDEEMKKSMEKMKGYQEMYLKGKREIYREW